MSLTLEHRSHVIVLCNVSEPPSRIFLHPLFCSDSRNISVVKILQHTVGLSKIVLHAILVSFRCATTLSCTWSIKRIRRESTHKWENMHRECFFLHLYVCGMYYSKDTSNTSSLSSSFFCNAEVISIYLSLSDKAWNFSSWADSSWLLFAS